MKALFHLGHPAHFHLFKNVISQLKENGHSTAIAIKKKDVLENLLISSGFDYVNILPDGRKDDKLSIALGQLKQDFQLLKLSLKEKPDVLVGTSVAISHVGKLLGIPSVNLNEDDAEAVPLYAKLAYPWATKIIAPNVCSVGKWEAKKVGYEGYHELAYLHPENFTPDREIASKYMSLEKPVTLIRFAKLGAHHDTGISGITDDLALQIIDLLKDRSDVIITSERKFSAELEPYRKAIDPKDMHHVMAHARFYIGDSQTMAAEAGVLGVPFVRFNDFVGRIGYLDELENKYHLGVGIKPSESERLLKTIEEVDFSEQELQNHQAKKARMLAEKVNLAAYLYNYLVNQEYLKS
ncbi:MAG: DUF354 domain-containing protein [Flavobacteriales bacterium]|nr:DUF354 domain-containing protein [Flavobacteriales bacterium]